MYADSHIYTKWRTSIHMIYIYIYIYGSWLMAHGSDPKQVAHFL